MPLAHETQEEEPGRAAYEPTAHAIQTSGDDAAATFPYVPAAHCVHVFDVVAPAMVPYEPILQSVHWLISRVVSQY